jgi:hypothetical protein
MAAILRRRKMREGFATGLNTQQGSASYAVNQFPQHLTLSHGKSHSAILVGRGLRVLLPSSSIVPACRKEALPTIGTALLDASL